MKAPHLLALALALANGCADSDFADRVAPATLTSGPRATGATPSGATPGHLGPVADYSAFLAGPAVATLDAVAERARASGGQVVSIDARLGVPTLLWAQTQAKSSDAGRASLEHLGHHRAVYGLSDSSLASATIDRIHDLGHGAIVVNLGQAIAGVPVWGVGVSVVMNRDNKLVAIAGRLHPAANAGAILPPLRTSASSAVAAAIDDVAGGAVRVLTERVSPVLYPHTKGLELAQLVELELADANSSDSRAYMVVVADDGRILERLDRTFSDAFRYRVWADQTAPFRPLDGPQGDWSPHPTGEPVELAPQFVAPALVEVDGINTNPEGSSDPWLPANATVTSGNNVRAYADHTDPDGFGTGDIRADLTSPGTFDHLFDPTLGPFVSGEQVKGSVVQIFYTVNWLHDYFYDSGFNEMARVAQDDNYGRGPGAGDPLLAEAQDTRGEARNNANMSTLGDGLPPRMQMYVWNGPVELVGETSLTITAPASIAGDYTAQGASFGVDDELSASGSLVMASPADGCGGISNSVSGQIVVIDRGDCTFVEKAQNAESAGATGVIIVNNQGTNSLPPLGGNDGDIAIPVVGVSSSSGQTIKGALAGGAVSGGAQRAGRIRGADRDGTVDNAIVAHEWGHYFHHRLSFCGGTQQCGAMSEGWGDFMSLALIVRDGDDLDGVYGVPSFVSSDPYFGIRRVPYSTRFDRNALTFKHIGESADLPEDEHPMQAFGANNEVHNAGEVWTTMLTEAYFALLRDERHSFDVAQRRFSDYLVGGLLASPPNATFTEVRDAILAVAAASDRADMIVIAEAFARRGAGTGAKSPDRSSETLDGVIESYEIAGEISVQSLSLPGDVDCDEDNNWDAEETAIVRIAIANAGPLGLDGTTVTVSASSDKVSFPDGNTTTIAALDGFGSGTADIAVGLAGDVASREPITFTATIENGDALTPELTATLQRRVNLDDVPASSASDDVESRLTAWTAESDVEAFSWTRVASGADLNTMWHVTDASTQADIRLESPVLEVGDEPLVIELEHRYSFEESDGTAWDGGVIEISSNGGATWQDIGQVASYTGVLSAESGNPLGGRQAFTGQSAGYPQMTTATLDLGTQFAGRTLRVRFRVGTDGAVGDEGWHIDNLAFRGITNTPFATIGDDEGSCDGIIDPEDDGSGCGCQSGSGDGSPLFILLGLALLALLRRRPRTHT